jgi:DNA invertase Pin-like site-specific DNA recombinase
MKVIAYIRVSTEHQVESGLGLEAQENSIAEWAKKTKLNIHESYRDEGMSGSLALDKRPGMFQAISSLTKNAVLVVAKRDRLGRDPMVLAMIESAVKRKGARIVSVAGEGTENDDPSNILMRRMIDAFGEYERLIIGARTKVALKAKKDKGQRVGRIPFGNKLAKDGVHLEPNSHEIDTLKEMQMLRANKSSIRTIAKTLNAKGTLNREGSKWNHASVHRMLKKV